MAKSVRPRFSVVVPAFNEAFYIADTLGSLRQQDFAGPYEIVVVDNNCTDETAQIAERFGARVVTEPNAGVCWARQRGTEAARGEIVISTDADTVFRPQWLSQIDAAFRRNPDAVAVAGPCRYTGGPWWGRAYPYLLFGFIYWVSRLTHRTHYVTATNLAFKKSAWPGYNTHLTQGGDELDLLRRLQQRGRVVFDNKITSHTSARRLERGFMYNVVVTLLIFYFLEYFLSRLLNRPVLGAAPAIRGRVRPPSLRTTQMVVVALLIGAFSLFTPAGHFLVHHTGSWVQSVHARGLRG